MENKSKLRLEVHGFNGKILGVEPDGKVAIANAPNPVAKDKPAAVELLLAAAAELKAQIPKEDAEQKQADETERARMKRLEEEGAAKAREAAGKPEEAKKK